MSRFRVDAPMCWTEKFLTVVRDDEKVMDVTLLEAEQLLRQLDLARFPWGEPGVVPTGITSLYVFDAMEMAVDAAYIQPMLKRASRLMSLADDGFPWWNDLSVDDDGLSGLQFRRRWTPEAP